MRYSVIALAALTTGCSGLKEMDTGGGDMLGTCERPQHGLSDLSEGFSGGGCDVQQSTGATGPGANSYFYGVYKDTGDGFTGYEEWHLFANETWSDSGGRDCVMRWIVDATRSDAETCGGCDFALDVTLTFDESCSTCPETLIESEKGTSFTRYEVMRRDDGTTRWFFAESGNEFGSGRTNDTAMNFATDESCRWF